MAYDIQILLLVRKRELTRLTSKVMSDNDCSHVIEGNKIDRQVIQLIDTINMLKYSRSPHYQRYATNHSPYLESLFRPMLPRHLHIHRIHPLSRHPPLPPHLNTRDPQSYNINQKDRYQHPPPRHHARDSRLDVLPMQLRRQGQLQHSLVPSLRGPPVLGIRYV